MTTRHIAARPLVLAVLAVVTVGACRGKKPVAPPPEPVPQAIDSTAIKDSIARAQRERDEAIRRQRARDDSIAAANAARDAAAMQARLRDALTAVIHFEFDQSDLRDDARSTLDAKVPILMANPEVTIRIAGHTDERGSTEYNLALGQRRAAAAKRYLTDRGVPAGRIETASMGEQQPVADGHDESAWASNRRDEFEITGGGGRLTSPRM
jgi:peptidoglycan-associated lipoprotein